MRFHYEHDGQRHGPCTVGQLRNMADFGGLSLETRVCAEGSERWISLGSLLHSTSVAAEEARSRDEPRREAPRLQANAPSRPTPGGFGVASAPAVRRMNQLASRTGGIKNRALYIILAATMGPLGVHNLYAGYKGRGIAQLLISIFLGWMIIPFALVCFWVLVEIFTVEKDATGVPFG